MAKTQTDLVTLAYRLLGVIDLEESPTTAEDTHGDALSAAIYEELQAQQGLAISWALANAIPDEAFIPFAYVLAFDLAPTMQVSAPISRGVAMARLRGALAPDDREDFRDTDDSGTVDADEADAGARAAYY